MLCTLCTRGDPDFGSRMQPSKPLEEEKLDGQQSNRGRGYNWLSKRADNLYLVYHGIKKERAVCTVLQASNR